MNLMRIATSPLQVRIWERLQLVVGEAGREGVYSCRVSDIKRDRLVISRPEFDYGHSLLADNRIVSVRFTRADAAYSFTARLKETDPKSVDVMYLLDLGEIRRLQRRRFVRLDKCLVVAYRVLPRPLEFAPDLSDDTFTSTHSINISAGGMLVTADENMTPGALLILKLSDSKIKHIPRRMLAICRQVRTMDNGNRGAGVEFILDEDICQHLSRIETALLPDDIHEFTVRMQNDLVSELFAEQLTLRQKGLI